MLIAITIALATLTARVAAGDVTHRHNTQTDRQNQMNT